MLRRMVAFVVLISEAETGEEEVVTKELETMERCVKERTSWSVDRILILEEV